MHGVPVSPHHVVPLVSDMRMLSPTKGLKLKMVLAINKKDKFGCNWKIVCGKKQTKYFIMTSKYYKYLLNILNIDFPNLSLIYQQIIYTYLCFLININYLLNSGSWLTIFFFIFPQTSSTDSGGPLCICPRQLEWSTVPTFAFNRDMLWSKPLASKTFL